MILAVDGYEANTVKRVGIGRYAYEILHHMYAVLAKDAYRTTTVRVYISAPPVSDMPVPSSWWQYRVVKPAMFWTRIGLPFTLAMDKPRADIIFSPTHYCPAWITIPKTIAIMDTSYLHYPTMFRVRDLTKLVVWTKQSAQRAVHIFTISKHSKDDIITSYRVSEDSVSVTYPGLSMVPNKHDKNVRMMKTYHIPDRYILSVGTLQPRKNFTKLIEAFAQFAKTQKALSKDTGLVIVGKKGWMYEDIYNAPKKYAVEDRVYFVDFVPDSDLDTFYRNALCFVLPSLYEGFGLPVLEAMAYGCPVVVSRVSSLPEIAGDAGIYIDPQNANSIADGITQAIREIGTRKGEQRIARGKRQADKFSWEKAARQTLKVLEGLVQTKYTI